MAASSAPWPYAHPTEKTDRESAPVWRCPEDTCMCHPLDAPERGLVARRVVLFDEEARRMPGARVRVWNAGRIVNRDAPHADGDGVCTFQVPPEVSHVLLEWAPPDTPLHPMLPFRITYHIDLGERVETRVERRLHNVGFCFFPSVEQNVHAFQRVYGPPGVPSTGRPEDIDLQLEHYHDSGALPPIPEPHAPGVGAPGEGSARESVTTEPFEIGVETGEDAPWSDVDELVIVDARGEQVFRKPLGAGRSRGAIRTHLWDGYEKGKRYTVKVRFDESAYILYQALDVYDHLSAATLSPPLIPPAVAFVDDAS